MRVRLFVVAALAGVSACAGVPSGSEPVVVRHLSGTSIDQQPNVSLLIPGPTVGARPVDIVRGFLTASSEGTDARHQVARQFLTRRAVATWRANRGTVVYVQSFVNPLGASAGRARVEVSMQRLATVSAAGSYRPNAARVSTTFTLTKVKGEWRIANPPHGLFVLNVDFNRNFQRADVYFLNPNRDVVVPDPRYFEVPGHSLTNRLVQALLAGPSPWLEPAVTTAFPSGASLRRSIVADSPVIDVDLTHLGTPSQAALRGMSAQLVWTLSKLNSSSVRITANGRPLVVPGMPREQQYSDWQGYDPDVLPANRSLYEVYNGAVWNNVGAPVPGPAGQGDYELSSVAVSLDGKKMAGVGRIDGMDHLFVGRFGGTLVKHFQAARLTPPTWGHGSSEVWTVRNGSDLIKVPVNGSAQVVASPALSEVTPIRQLRLSRDGTRVAVIGRHGRLYVGRVTTHNGNTTVSGLFLVAQGMHGFTDVTWASADQLDGLAPNSTSTRVPWTMSVDGSTRGTYGTELLPGEPTGIAAAPDQLTVVSSAHRLSYLVGTSWSPMSGGQGPVLGDAPVYPG